MIATLGSHSPSLARDEVCRIVIVDDHPVVRRGLADTIDAEPDLSVCAQAWDRESALEAIARERPALVLLDIGLPGETGLTLLKELREQYGDTAPKVLVVSMYDENMFAERAVKAGAAGYISKHEGIGNLLTAIRSVLSGQIYLSPELTERVLRRAAGKASRERLSDVATLSDRELEVFRLLGSGVPTRQIAEMLKVSRKTIEAHREHIKKKLDLKNANELVVRATAWVLDRQ